MNHIDNNNSFIFKAGAGAGKTYTLIECLKYLIKSKYQQFLFNNQKIMCITFTNVAKNEIIERLGNSTIVDVSTIHERIWNMICRYQHELLEIHKEELKEQIKKFEMDIESDNDFISYSSLNPTEKEKFKKIILQEDIKQKYKEKNIMKVQKLNQIFKEYLKDFDEILKNNRKFKKIVDTIYKIHDYEICLKYIEEKKEGYDKIEYVSSINRDRLEKMKISHDTVLKYGEKMVNRHDILKKIIIDKYPYIFIDEYQDTNEKVVNLIDMLYKYAKKKKKELVIGYFGDPLQKIYYNNFDNEIENKIKGFKVVNKKINRRSTVEIINVANKIRNDNFKQEPLFKDHSGGTVKFYIGSEEDIKPFIEKYTKKWKNKDGNPLHCFMLTNQLVAKYAGFEEIYEKFKDTDKYKKNNFSLLNSELMSQDLTKLGDIPLLLFNIINFIYNSTKKSIFIKDIVKIENFDNINVQELKNVKKLLSNISGDTLKKSLEKIFEVYEKDNKGYFRKIVNSVIDIDEKNLNMEVFKNYLFKKLFPNSSIDNQKIKVAKQKIDKLLEIEIKIYNNWRKFLLLEPEENVIYHTYHSTKGKEYENVLIIMQKDFGRLEKDFFSDFFKFFDDDKISEDKKGKINRARNLLYVAVTRAIKNLRILYIVDNIENVSCFQENIEKIFGKLHKFRL